MSRSSKYYSEYPFITRCFLLIAIFLYATALIYSRSHASYSHYWPAFFGLAVLMSFTVSVRLFKSKPARIEPTWLDRFVENNIPTKAERVRIRAYNREARDRRRDAKRHRRQAESSDSYRALLHR